MTFRINQILKRGGMPRDAKSSKELQDLLEQLPAGEGIELETWHSGRIWVEAKAITFWEDPAHPAMIREILCALNLEPVAYRHGVHSFSGCRLSDKSI